MAPPMFNGGYYAIPGYVVAETVKPQFLFLFLPRKEKIKVAIGVPSWWRVLSLQESGWGPPDGSLRMAHQEFSEFRDAEETGLSGLLPPDYPACYHRIIRSATTGLSGLTTSAQFRAKMRNNLTWGRILSIIRPGLSGHPDYPACYPGLSGFSPSRVVFIFLIALFPCKLS